MGIKNEEKLAKWISEQKPGYRFTVKELTGRINLDSVFIGHCFKWMPGVKKGDLLPGGAREWIICPGAS